jgi:hypothetical protein
LKAESANLRIDDTSRKETQLKPSNLRSFCKHRIITALYRLVAIDCPKVSLTSPMHYGIGCAVGCEEPRGWPWADDLPSLEEAGFWRRGFALSALREMAGATSSYCCSAGCWSTPLWLAAGPLYKSCGRGHVAVHLDILHSHPLARPCCCRRDESIIRLFDGVIVV